MASATVDDRRGGCDLHMESLPLVDVRLLSRQELLALSRCSASNPPISALDTDLLIPKIDRSVFNESAGSRKQTFSRLRLAPPRSSFHFSSPPKPFSASSSMVPEPVGEDNGEVVPLLKALFNISSEGSPTIDLDSANLVSVRVESEDNASLPWETGVQPISVDVVDYSERKRKRGRPPKNIGENWAIGKDIVLYENPDGMSRTSEKSGGLSNSDGVKRKRGRPRKNESQNSVVIREDSGIKSEGDSKNMVLCDDVAAEMVTVNEKCGMVDWVALERDDKESWVTRNEAIVAQRNPDAMLHVNERSGDVRTTSEIKRKRGRPRKNVSEHSVLKKQRIIESEGDSKKNVTCDSVNGEMVAVNEGDSKKNVLCDSVNAVMVVVNDNKGEMVDLVALGKIEDPFGEELGKRTEGMRTEGEFLEFMKRLEGDWVSQRKKRRIVDADKFGHILPKGWKLMLFVKKNAGRKWLACRRYISPNGQQFMSCKEVSSYLLSSIRLQGASHPNSVSATHGIKLVDNQPSEEVLKLLPVTSSEHHDQAVLLKTGNSGNFNGYGKIKCHKCTMNFDLEDDFISHLLSSHQSTEKGLDHNEMIMKDGKYECQLCHKLFEEKHHHDNHLRLHTGNHEKEVQQAVDMTVIQPQLKKVDTPVSEVQGSIRVLKDYAETDSRTVSVQMGAGLPASEVGSYGSMHGLGCSSQDVATFTDEDHEQKDRVCVTIPNEVEKTHQLEKEDEEVDLCPDTSLVELKADIDAEMTLADDVPHLEDLQTDSKEQSSFEDVSVISCDNEQRFDITDHDIGVLPPVTENSVLGRVSENRLISPPDENDCVVNSTSNCFSASALDNPELCLFTSSAIKESTIDFLGSQEEPKTLQGRGIDGTSLALHGNDNSCKISDKTRDKFLPSQVGDATGSFQFVSSGSTGYCDNVFDYFEPEKLQASQFTISSEKRPSSTLEEVNQDKGYISNRDCRESTVIEQNNVNKLKENMYSVGGSCFSSSKEQTFFGINMNALPMSTALEGSNFDAFENSRRTGVAMGFPDLVQHSGDAISQLVWKNGQDNFIPTSLNDSSAPLFQSAGSYPKFDAVSYKGEHDFFSFIEAPHSNISSIEGMRPGGVEPMEYNFFSDPASTHLENSKVTSYNSVWMEKEGMNLLPKIPGRNQNTISCSWCGNAFHDEAMNISPQGVAPLHMCPICRDRLSRNDGFF